MVYKLIRLSNRLIKKSKTLMQKHKILNKFSRVNHQEMIWIQQIELSKLRELKDLVILIQDQVAMLSNKNLNISKQVTIGLKILVMKLHIEYFVNFRLVNHLCM